MYVAICALVLHFPFQDPDMEMSDKVSVILQVVPLNRFTQLILSM